MSAPYYPPPPGQAPGPPYPQPPGAPPLAMRPPGAPPPSFQQPGGPPGGACPGSARRRGRCGVARLRVVAVRMCF